MHAEEQNLKIAYKLEDFEGPLDLLLNLIEKNKMNIYDISIHEITQQYLAAIADLAEEDMENASDFLYMAATLLYIKSKTLLPSVGSSADEDDVAGDLVLKLLAYRRCKYLAKYLKNLFNTYAYTIYREESSPDILGLPPREQVFPPLKSLKFYNACQNIKLRNQTRFVDLSPKMSTILKKDRYPLHLSLETAWQEICQKKKLYFRELLSKESPVEEQVSTFLAILELLRMGHISVLQKEEFGALYIEKNQASSIEAEDILATINSLKK